jgi:hypothetical protein
MEPLPLIIKNKQRSYWLGSFLLYQIILRRKEPDRKEYQRRCLPLPWRK